MSSAVTAFGRPGVLTDRIAGGLLSDVALVVGGAAFVGLLAQVSFPVPGSPVPVTGQTFAVLVAGATLGWRRGSAAMALYLVAGLAGVPCYAGHTSGVGSAFGYVIGFVLAGSVVGALAARGGDRTPLRMLGTMTLGTVLVYAVGVPYLAADLHLGVGAALRVGLRPFLLGDAAKVVLAAGLFPAAWALTGRRREH